jgi:Protein of unknown function (DUF998)
VSRAGANQASDTLARRTRRLLTCGAVAGPLFVSTFLVEGAMRAGYDPLRHPVSSLALGPGGWRQVANFGVTGLLYLGFAAGLTQVDEPPQRSRSGPLLIGAAAVGLLGSAAFATDPVGGYPPGTPADRPGYTRAGALHDLFAGPTFLGLPAAQLAYAWRFHRAGERKWAAYSASSAVAMLVGVARANAGFSQDPRFVRLGGLFQRVTVITGFGWLTALAVHSLKAGRP